MTNQQLSPIAKKALQQALIDLTDPSPLGRQAYWNTEGSRLRALHLQLNEIVDEIRMAPDDVTERLAAPDEVPDARAATVAAAPGLKQSDASYLSADEICSQFEELLMTVSDRIKATLDPVDDVDRLNNDMPIGITTGLEKQAWMLRSTTANG